MLPIDVYRIYVAIKTHFTTDKYDFVAFNGKTKYISQSTYNKRKDKYFFEQLSVRYRNDEIVPFFISNFLVNEKMWIGDMQDEGRDIFLEWKKRWSSLYYNYTQDVGNIIDFVVKNELSMVDIFTGDGSKHPIILKFLQQKMVSLETVVILNKIINFIPSLEKHYSDDLILGSLIQKVKKYSSFFKEDYKKYDLFLKEACKDR